MSATDILTDINAVEDALETELFGNGHCHSGNFFIFFFIIELCSILSNLTKIMSYEIRDNDERILFRAYEGKS